MSLTDGLIDVSLPDPSPALGAPSPAEGRGQQETELERVAWGQRMWSNTHWDSWGRRQWVGRVLYINPENSTNNTDLGSNHGLHGQMDFG